MAKVTRRKLSQPQTKRVGRANWFEHFFHGVAVDCWRKCVAAEQTKAEADFLEKMLGKRIPVLDVPCGLGRHSLELARRGCRVTGVDLSSESIADAKATAKASGLTARFCLGDMRRLSFRAEFDGAFCMGNSFGYFEPPDMIEFVTGFARALRPGGRFVIDTGCAAESILPALQPRATYQVDEIEFTIENHYDAQNSCLETECTFSRKGQTERRKFWHWVFTVGEIQRLLRNAGLEVKEFYGSLDRQLFRLGNRVLYLVGEKVGTGRRH